MLIQMAQVDSDFSPLRQFRQQVYPLLGPRKDVLFELMDAVIQTPHARSFAELALAPACTRKYHSIYKALDAPVRQPTVAEITVEPAAPSPVQAVQAFCAEQLPTDRVAQFAIDVSGVRRMRSPTLQERQYYHGAARARPWHGHGRRVALFHRGLGARARRQFCAAGSPPSAGAGRDGSRGGGRPSPLAGFLSADRT